MNSCQAKQTQLKAYLDGELPYTQHVSVWWHLLHCAECREARKGMTEISRRLNVRDSQALDPVLRARILSSVTYAQIQPEETGVRQRPNRALPLLLAGGATAAALLVFVMMRPFVPAAPKADGPLSQAAPFAAERAVGGTGAAAGMSEPSSKSAPVAAPSRSFTSPAADGRPGPSSAARQDAIPESAGKSQLMRSPAGSVSSDTETQKQSNAFYGGTRMGSKNEDHKTYYNGAGPPALISPQAKNRPSLEPGASRPSNQAAQVAKPLAAGGRTTSTKAKSAARTRAQLRSIPDKPKSRSVK